MNWIWMDMDSYFASVEQYFRPELRGRAIGVVPVESDHTCVIAASHQAKRFGVKVGTGVRDARRLCPGILLVQARPAVYVRVHHRILESVNQQIEIHRVYSIDEWTIRLRGLECQPEVARRIGQRVKRQLLDDFGPWITGSIGIAPTRLLAKIASKLEKPNGLTVLPLDEMPRRIEHLRLDDLHGISHGMLARLEAHGVRSVRELWDVSRHQAIRIWGSVSGAQWWAGLHGYDEPEPPTQRRSMTHGNVLEPRFRNEEGACTIMARLVCKLAERLRRGGYLARSLRISVRTEGGETFSEEIGLPFVQDTSTLLKQFYLLWRRRAPGRSAIKKVDVCVAGLVPEYQVPDSLLDEVRKLQRLSRVIDEINLLHGPFTVYFGPLHQCRQHMDNKIAFGRIPDEID